MLKAPQILVRTIVLATSTAALWGCGQRGPLFLPTEPAAAQRATLPQALNPTADDKAQPSTTNAPASTPR